MKTFKLPPSAKFGIVIAAMVGGYGWFMSSQISSAKRLDCDELSANKMPDVVIYGTDWCQFCKKTRWFFDDHEVSYCEYDIEKSAVGASEFNALNGEPLPLVMINGERVEGFNKERLKQALINQNLWSDG